MYLDDQAGRRILPIAMGDALAKNVLLVSVLLVSLRTSRVNPSQARVQEPAGISG